MKIDVLDRRPTCEFLVDTFDMTMAEAFKANYGSFSDFNKLANLLDTIRIHAPLSMKDYNFLKLYINVFNLDGFTFDDDNYIIIHPVLIQQRQFEGTKLPEKKKTGLYLVGSTNFNPYTDEKFYWIKIGKAKNMWDRMGGYSTHNPMCWKADFLYGEEAYSMEGQYHAKLAAVAFEKGYRSDEWFRVSRETYLAICEKGFAYFKQGVDNNPQWGL